jgi:hypothetical protein
MKMARIEDSVSDMSDFTARPAKDTNRGSIDERITEKQVDKFMSEFKRVEKLRKSPEGKYKVIGVDKFSSEDWVQGEYDTAGEAVAEARRLTAKDASLGVDNSIATVFYAYDPAGRYITRDIWRNEDG